ncbi:DUF3499 domain-containing protein [Myceligenerans salitolerans]|uniref:DUF3499 domain-containing protein n=1 Tax=Myceligenerans salitolerans TaxID=1230528 RepID=A0ABS3I850_9MICO|nr:DUF3499 domain-containing protein [Myceligenerans salitolerans]MBO0609165.1 DUF3499 domain-containing protein [Myceligenerans salitolerans]
MRSVRQCSRSACTHAAVATLTYVYADSTAVLGPLAHLAEPHSYDLCSEHAEGLTAPRGWEVVRLVAEFPAEPAPSPDDLSALADAVREAGRTRRAPDDTTESPTEPGVTETARRGHLRVLRAED